MGKKHKGKRGGRGGGGGGQGAPKAAVGNNNIQQEGDEEDGIEVINDTEVVKEIASPAEETKVTKPVVIVENEVQPPTPPVKITEETKIQVQRTPEEEEEEVDNNRKVPTTDHLSKTNSSKGLKIDKPQPEQVAAECQDEVHQQVPKDVVAAVPTNANATGTNKKKNNKKKNRGNEIVTVEAPGKPEVSAEIKDGASVVVEGVSKVDEAVVEEQIVEEVIKLEVFRADVVVKTGGKVEAAKKQDNKNNKKSDEKDKKNDDQVILPSNPVPAPEEKKPVVLLPEKQKETKEQESEKKVKPNNKKGGKNVTQPLPVTKLPDQAPAPANLVDEVPVKVEKSQKECKKEGTTEVNKKELDKEKVKEETKPIDPVPVKPLPKEPIKGCLKKEKPTIDNKESKSTTKDQPKDNNKPVALSEILTIKEQSKPLPESAPVLKMDEPLPGKVTIKEGSQKKQQTKNEKSNKSAVQEKIEKNLEQALPMPAPETPVSLADILKVQEPPKVSQEMTNPEDKKAKAKPDNKLADPLPGSVTVKPDAIKPVPEKPSNESCQKGSQKKDAGKNNKQNKKTEKPEEPLTVDTTPAKIIVKPVVVELIKDTPETEDKSTNAVKPSATEAPIVAEEKKALDKSNNTQKPTNQKGKQPQKGKVSTPVDNKQQKMEPEPVTASKCPDKSAPATKCPYEHPMMTQEDTVKPPQITGMVFETKSKEEVHLLKDKPKDLKKEILMVEPVNESQDTTDSEWTDVKAPKNKTQAKKNTPLKKEESLSIPEESPSDLIPLHDIPLDSKPTTPPPLLTTDKLLMQSMSDSTISDLTVVVEQSLENISNVPDEEIMKLFDIVSKDFEKTPEPRCKPAPSPHVFQEPIAQAGAALATLIEAVEQTESRIKETVEETKKKQQKNKHKKRQSKTPEKVLEDKKDLLSDTVIVDQPFIGPMNNPELEAESSRKSKSPSKKSTSSSSSGDPKNVPGSDFVPSVEAQRQDEAKSLPKKDIPGKASPSKSPIKTKTTSPPVLEKINRVVKQESPAKNMAKPIVPPRPEATKNPPKNTTAKKPQSPAKTTAVKPVKPKPAMIAIDHDDDSEDEEYIEYKFSPRKVFLHYACHTCQSDVRAKPHLCPNCHMLSYCSEKHCHEDLPNHRDFCQAIQEVAKKRGGHVYNNAKILPANEFRNLRVHTLNLCTTSLKRPLQPFEKEMLLFPRLCVKPDCKNWKPEELISCGKCHQVAFCKAHPDHLPESHTQSKWCQTYVLYQKLVLSSKRIEPPMPTVFLKKPMALPQSMDELLKTMYGCPIKDLCSKVVLSQLATGPLTALNALQLCKVEMRPTMVIHLIGAELQFEGDTLDKWEAFFLHLVPGLTELRVVFVGPELNVENLPVEILSRIRMCRSCRMTARNVKFDFQCRTLYHDYVKSSAFTKPDLICYFNPGLYRMTGFSGQDTWPETLTSSLQLNCPIVVTSYTEVESPLDFAQIEKFASEGGSRTLELVQPSASNPFASQRPERNFISDDVAPMIFKNYYHFVVK